MKQGDEVTIAYIPPTSPYDERRYRLMKSWRFNCACGLCEADDGDGYEARATRYSLSKAMSGIMATFNGASDAGSIRRIAANAKRTCDDLTRTYNGGHSDNADGIKHELAEVLRRYAIVVERLGRVTSDLSFLNRAIELKMDSLTFNGLRVTDRTTSGALPDGDQTSSLPVDTSRASAAEHDIGVLTVFHIVNLFKELGEKKRARHWFDVAVWSAPSVSSFDIC